MAARYTDYELLYKALFGSYDFFTLLLMEYRSISQVSTRSL